GGQRSMSNYFGEPRVGTAADEVQAELCGSLEHLRTSGAVDPNHLGRHFSASRGRVTVQPSARTEPPRRGGARARGKAEGSYDWAFTTSTGKLPNTSTSLTVPKPPSMNTKPDGPNVGAPPDGLVPTKVMSFLLLPPKRATSKAKVAVAALARFPLIV